MGLAELFKCLKVSFRKLPEKNIHLNDTECQNKLIGIKRIKIIKDFGKIILFLGGSFPRKSLSSYIESHPATHQDLKLDILGLKFF